MNFPSPGLSFSFHLPLQKLPLDERYFYTSRMILPTHLNSKAAIEPEGWHDCPGNGFGANEIYIREDGSGER